jgi:hypothetical protein
MTAPETTKMTSAKFSEFVLSIDDLYNMGIRNGFYLPKQSSSAVNELMLTNVLKKNYWCPMTKDIRLKSIVKAPLKEVILVKLCQICVARKLNIAWIDDVH